MAGADDQVTGPAEARALVAGIPDARLAVVPGAAHLAPVEQPAAVTDLLARHFSTAWQPDRPATGRDARPAGPVRRCRHAAAVAPAPSRRGRAAAVARPARRRTPRIKVRREVLGDAHVDRALAAADDFGGDFQEFVTRYAWGEIWDRPGPRPAHPQLRHAHRAGRRRPPRASSPSTPAPPCATA